VRLEGRVCLVTGAAGGIGRAAATALEAAGARVVAVDRAEADLAEPGAAARLAAKAGEIDVLVNNAGVGLHGRVADLDAEELRRVLTVDLEAPIELTRALLPGMLARGRGHVVNVGSIVGLVGRPNEAVYAAGKAGLAIFTESLRSELRGTGVSASLIVPAVVETRFFAERGVPYGRNRPRPVRPERIAGAIVDAIRRDRARVVVPGWLAVAVRLHGAAPGAFRALADRFD
jgi:short-subunit dehydrogenase